MITGGRLHGDWGIQDLGPVLTTVTTTQKVPTLNTLTFLRQLLLAHTIFNYVHTVTIPVAMAPVIPKL